MKIKKKQIDNDYSDAFYILDKIRIIIIIIYLYLRYLRFLMNFIFSKLFHFGMTSGKQDIFELCLGDIIKVVLFLK